MTDRPICTQCGSPDLAPYRFTSEWAGYFRNLYPHAMTCVDCGFTVPDATRVAAPRMLSGKFTITKTPWPKLGAVIDHDPGDEQP